MKRFYYFSTFILLFTFTSANLYSQRNGTLEGVVKDNSNGEVLPYTSVQLVGTTYGGITDGNGFYQIQRVPAGNYTLKATFVGYEEASESVSVSANTTTVQNIDLRLTSYVGEEVTITAIALGQVKAINTQLEANTIKNVVSEQKIRELPDQNAAEALMRLPGISVSRSGGEATSVTIRGVGGSQLYVNGMSLAGGLSSISSSMIGGIEVSKAFLPDREANVLGGTVDFKMREAPVGFRKEIWLKQGYNGFSKSFNMHDASVLLSNRFLDNKLGVMWGVNWDRKNRGRDIMYVDYLAIGTSKNSEEVLPVFIDQLILNHTESLNDRIGSTVYLDYQLKTGKLFLQSFYSNRNSDIQVSSQRMDLTSVTTNNSNEYKSKQVSFMNGIGGDHNIGGVLKINWDAYYSQGKDDDLPGGLSYASRDTEGTTNTISIDSTSTIADLYALYLPNVSSNYADALSAHHSISHTNILSGKLDLELPFQFGNNIGGYLKFGGQFRRIDRESDNYSRHTDFRTDSYLHMGDQLPTLMPDVDWTYTSSNYIGHERFASMPLAKDFSFGGFQMYNQPDFNFVRRVYNVTKDQFANTITSDKDDYINTEDQYAGYLMGSLNLGNIITFTPGVRYEHESYETTARALWFVQPNGAPEQQGEMRDTSSSGSNENFFPMFHLKIKPLNWFDIRLAYTKTTSRPGFSSMSPRFYRTAGFDLLKGNVNLNPQINYNYDIYLSFYNKWVGLFTAGAFYKEFYDQVLNYGITMIDPAEFGLPVAYKDRVITQPVNNQWPGYVRGIEFDLQTHLSYLPKPFHGLVLNANITYMQSNTKYPFFSFEKIKIPVRPYVQTIGSHNKRSEKIVGMPDFVGNLSLGYEVGGFSARVSGYYQSRTITTAQAQNLTTDVDRDQLVRFDLQMSQRILKVPLLVAYININNLTNNHDRNILTHHPERITKDEVYGTAGDIGIRLKF